ncbi:DNA-directed RNA polymerase II core subunit rpb9 [Oleoguttula sp. CCFEE 5521]
MTSYDTDDIGADVHEEGSKKISFRFCRECSNMLYPNANNHDNTLMFSCKSCQYSEEARAACVYRNSLQEQIAETAGNVEDVAQDPTVGDDPYVMPIDSFMEGGDADDDDPMPEMCTFCGQEILCPLCGQASDGYVALEVDDPEQKMGGAVEEEELVEAEKRERTMSSAGT